MTQPKSNHAKDAIATLQWTDTGLRLLDQTRLPAEEVYLQIESTEQLEDCIQRLVVRGAPAIGCAAAFGAVLAARQTKPAAAASGRLTQAWLQSFSERC